MSSGWRESMNHCARSRPGLRQINLSLLGDHLKASATSALKLHAFSRLGQRPLWAAGPQFFDEVARRSRSRTRLAVLSAQGTLEGQALTRGSVSRAGRNPCDAGDRSSPELA